MTKVFDNGKLKRAQDAILDEIVKELEEKSTSHSAYQVVKELAESFNLLQSAAAKD